MHRLSRSLSLIFLAYNEEGAISSVLDEAIRFAEEHLRDWEIVVVDDGSKDRTAEIVREHASRDGRVRLIQHVRNRGMGAGMSTGIRSATKEYLIFNAADGQVSSYEIAKLLPLLDQADIVLSTYGNRRETLAREVVSRGFRLYLRALTGISFRLQGLYLYPTEWAKRIEPRIEANSFFFSFELIQRGVELGLSTATTQMICRPRAAGVSKVIRPKRVWQVTREVVDFAVRKRRERR